MFGNILHRDEAGRRRSEFVASLLALADLPSLDDDDDDDDLREEIAESTRERAELLSGVDELLRRLNERDDLPSSMPSSMPTESDDAGDERDDSAGGRLAKNEMGENYYPRPKSDIDATMPSYSASPDGTLDGSGDEVVTPASPNSNIQTSRPETPSQPDEANRPKVFEKCRVNVLGITDCCICHATMEKNEENAARVTVLNHFNCIRSEIGIAPLKHGLPLGNFSGSYQAKEEYEKMRVSYDPRTKIVESRRDCAEPPSPTGESTRRVDEGERVPSPASEGELAPKEDVRGPTLRRRECAESDRELVPVAHVPAEDASMDGDELRLKENVLDKVAGKLLRLPYGRVGHFSNATMEKSKIFGNVAGLTAPTVRVESEMGIDTRDDEEERAGADGREDSAGAGPEEEEEIAEWSQSGEVTCVSAKLRTDIEESQRNQAELLGNLDDLLRRLDEKDYVLSSMSVESDSLVPRKDVRAEEADGNGGYFCNAKTGKGEVVENMAKVTWLSDCVTSDIGGTARELSPGESIGDRDGDEGHLFADDRDDSANGRPARDEAEEDFARLGRDIAPTSAVSGLERGLASPCGGDEVGMTKDETRENCSRPSSDSAAMPNDSSASGSLNGTGEGDRVGTPPLPNLTIVTPRHETPPWPDEADTLQAPATPELPISDDSASSIAPDFDDSPLCASDNLDKCWEGKNAVWRELLAKLIGRLQETEERLSAATEKSWEMAQQLDEARGANDRLRMEVVASRRVQFRLLARLGPVAMMEKNDSAEKSAEAMGPDERVEAREARAGLPRSASEATTPAATSPLGAFENLRMKNRSLRERIDELVEYEIRDAWAGLLHAAAEDAESVVASLRDDVDKLRRENESLRERLDERQGESRGSGAEERPTYVPASRTSASLIDFDDATDAAGMARIPNGYRGFDWDNFGVMHRSARRSSGFERGIVSGDYVAFNGGGRPCSVSSATPFSVAGFHATAAYNEGSSVLVEGFDGGGKLVGSRRATLGSPRDGPTFVDLRGGKGSFEGLRRLRITTSCGANAIQGNSRSGVAIDHVLVYSDL
mmetsp:Transcript_8053/g.17431  ORF Transcript_8053/g.17431 Transcript_8053/m.17431 type:complete len:1059 (-) Transcript_8053:201-3377(-)